MAICLTDFLGLATINMYYYYYYYCDVGTLFCSYVASYPTTCVAATYVPTIVAKNNETHGKFKASPPSPPIQCWVEFEKKHGRVPPSVHKLPDYCCLIFMQHCTGGKGGRSETMILPGRFINFLPGL